jgi:hypothetical protein
MFLHFLNDFTVNAETPGFLPGSFAWLKQDEWSGAPDPKTALASGLSGPV